MTIKAPGDTPERNLSPFRPFAPKQSLHRIALDLPDLPLELAPEARFSWAADAWSDLCDVHAWLHPLNRAVKAADVAALREWAETHPAGQGWTAEVFAVSVQVDVIVALLDDVPAETAASYGMGDLMERIERAWQAAITEYEDTVKAARPEAAEDIVIGISDVMTRLASVATMLRDEDGEGAWSVVLTRMVRSAGFESDDLALMTAILDAEEK